MKKAFLVTLLLFWASFAVAQRGGIPSFGAVDTFDNDSINLYTLTPVLHFSLLPKGGGGASLQVISPQSCHQIFQNGNTNYYCGFTNASTQYLLPGFFFVPSELMLEAVGTTGGGGCPSLTATSLQGLDGLTSYPITSTTVYQSSACGATTVTATTIDGSGITATWSYSAGGAAGVTSAYNTSGWTWTNSTLKVADPFSNTQITWTSPLTSVTDALGAATTLGSATQGYGSPTSYGYTDAGGTSRTISMVAGTNTTFTPLGSCGANTSVSVTPPSSFSFPDGTSISLTWDSVSGSLDGLIKSFTNRNGGTITYTYGTISTCDPMSFPTLSRQTPDGTWSYSSNGTGTTTVLDPGKNKTVYTIIGSSPVHVTNTIVRYQNTGTVASPSYTKISETDYCYNNPASCSTAPTYPITQLDTYEYTYKPDGTQVQMSHDVKLYDSTYGLVTSDAATDSINSQTITTTYAYGTYSSGTCSAITNTKIVDHPCTVTTKNGSTWLSESTYTYNANGALTSSSACLSSTCTGSSALTTTYTPNSTGTYASIQDPNGQTVNYTYGSCNSLMPTDVTTTVNSIAIDRKATWNCNGGLVTDTTDPNSNEDDYTYDSMNRISTYHDRMGDTNTTSYAYGTPTLDHVKVTDNIGVVSYQYNDGLGRPTISQVYNGTNYDTVSHTYGWTDSMSHALTNFQTTTSTACGTTLDATCSTVAMTSLVNPIAGPYTNTDVNTGVTTFAVNSKDFSVTASPHPTNENNKVVQTEVDGFGRTTSVCALLTSGGSSCGQTMGNSGILTSNTYSFPSAGVSEVQTTRGSQTHTTKADAVGRTTSIQTPEANTVTYTYDSTTGTTCGTITSKGDLLEVSHSGSSIYECYNVDGLHRLTDVGNTTDNATNPCKRFRYDSTANNIYTKPTGYPSSGANLIGRLMEASTDDCTFPFAQAHMITDEWFAYDNMGRMTDMWETTPNSSGFYHTTATYDADGNVLTLTSSPTNFPTLTFTVDSEGRPFNAKSGSTWIVGSSSTTGVTYDNASMPLTIPIGSGGGSDTYTYDSLEQMKTYTFAGNSKSIGGTLTWNHIGSLGTLAITDTFNSGGAQTCNYLYDDVGRLGVPPNSPTPPNSMGTKSVDCSTVFNAEYGYDQYDNLETAGSYSWTPGYSSTNNQQTGSTYDSDGNVTNDAVNLYTWNAYGKLASEIPGSTAAVCGTSGSCLTYDALGRSVERNASGSYTQYLYGPTGLLGQAQGTSLVILNIGMPGGGEYMGIYNNTDYYLHSDWVGTKRLATKVSDGSQLWDTAYSPYGRDYDTFGSLEVKEFAGTSEYTIFTLFDTPNRNLFKNSARWLSPDPAHSGWNAYAYVTDPNTQTDPSGLRECGKSDDACVTASADDVDTSLFYWGEVNGRIGGSNNIGTLVFRSNHSNNGSIADRCATCTIGTTNIGHGGSTNTAFFTWWPYLYLRGLNPAPGLEGITSSNITNNAAMKAKDLYTDIMVQSRSIKGKAVNEIDQLGDNPPPKSLGAASANDNFGPRTWRDIPDLLGDTESSGRLGNFFFGPTTQKIAGGAISTITKGGPLAIFVLTNTQITANELQDTSNKNPALWPRVTYNDTESPFEINGGWHFFFHF